jgi:uncharacterized protein (UPF0333 family)
MEKHTSKHFVLQLGALASLYLSLAFFVTMLFSVINIAYPDVTNYAWETASAHDMVRMGIAVVIVFFPTYLFLTRRVNTIRRETGNVVYLELTKWLIYLSLLVGGGVLLSDLVTLIITFLNGEITTRFILKVLVVLVVIGAAFYYYVQDAKGWWTIHERQSKKFGAVMTALVLAGLCVAFFYTETPAEVREGKLDERQIMDLQSIQWRVQDFAVTERRLPASLGELKGQTLPNAPENRSAYEYKANENGFILCATFAQPSQADNGYYGPSIAKTDPYAEDIYLANPDAWQHEAGAVCFDRVVNGLEGVASTTTKR